MTGRCKLIKLLSVDFEDVGGPPCRAEHDLKATSRRDDERRRLVIKSVAVGIRTDLFCGLTIGARLADLRAVVATGTAVLRVVVFGACR